MTREKLYFFVFVACVAGYSWVAWSLWQENNCPQEQGIELCLFHRITKVPCPSCGSTRSVMSLFKGDFMQAVLYNPIGLLLVLIMNICPLWIVIDLIRGKDTFLQKYQQAELFLKKLPVALFFIVLILANWIWNIVKYF